VPDPVPPPAADVLLIESTYGNRLHKTLADTREELVEAIARAHRGGGNVVIPAFALGRTQEIMLTLMDLIRLGRIAHPPEVFIDSPLAEKATEISWAHMNDLDTESRALVAAWKAGTIKFKVHYSPTPDDSRRINTIRAGALILAGSGMCEAGRIRHHLLHNLGREECCIVFAGFQGKGTLGRAIIDGAKTVRLMREDVAVRAKVYTLGGLSAHADQAGLLSYISGIKKGPAMTYVVHGEPEVAKEFGQIITQRLGWATTVPTGGQTVTL
jgi:metallo-beta-lactamase family protein